MPEYCKQTVLKIRAINNRKWGSQYTQIGRKEESQISEIFLTKYKQYSTQANRMSIFNIFRRDEQPPAKQNSNAGFYSPSQSALPPDFAQNLLDLQMRIQFQDTIDIECVKQLNDMYRTAIEYYINEDPKKAQHFQRKLASLLANPSTLQAMNKVNTNPINGKQSAKQAPLSNNNKLLSGNNLSMSLKLQLGKFNSQAEGIVKSMVERTEENAAKTERMVRENLWKQEESLKLRMQERSSSRRRFRNVNDN